MSATPDRKITWVDMTSLGLHLGAYRAADGSLGIGIVDENNKHREKIVSLGFTAISANFAEGIYFSAHRVLQPQQLRQTFGNGVRVIKAEPELVNRAFSAAVRNKTRTNANVFFSQQQTLGLNHKSELVQESVVGRFVVEMIDNKPVIVPETKELSSRFLRAHSIESLSEIAEGFVLRALHRKEHLTKSDFKKLIEYSNHAGFDARTYQEAIEAAATRIYMRLSDRLGDKKDLALYTLANKIFDGLPAFNERTANSIANQQYSTPLPMAALMQLVLTGGDFSNKDLSVLDPTIGNGNLVSLFTGPNVYGVELDPDRIKQVSGMISSVSNADATSVDFRAEFNQPDGFDYVIANPPFGKLESKVDLVLPKESLIKSMQIARLDHLILLRALHARRATGRAVFITGADSALELGVIKGRSRALLNYLYDHYDVKSVVDVSGALYKQQGAQFPLRLYVIGDRKAVPEPSNVPEQLLTLQSYNDLKKWASNIINQVEIENVQDSDKKQKVRTDIENKNDSVLDVFVPETQAVLPPPEDVKNAMADALVIAEAEQEATDTDPREESEFQLRYISYSKVAEATTMIPANLSGPIYAALDAVVQKYGDIDEFVARELQFDVSELGNYFSPEQVDACALMFSATNNGQGFLLADKMGVGKGRVLAAAARRAKLQGKIPVFITEKDSLFTDFLERDVKAINSRHLFEKPLIINDQAKTIDENNAVVVRSISRDMYRRYAENAEIPPETDLIMLTYPQICRQPESHLTSRYMRHLAERYPLTLLIDESHNGAGSSNTSDNLDYMINALGRRGDVIYSSGTPIKGATNLRLYSRIFPLGMNFDELLSVVLSDPLSMQEALSYEIAIQGCLISRELDNSGIEKTFVVSPNLDRNRAIADQMAEILTAMSFLGGDVNKIVTKMNENFVKDFKKVAEEDRDGARMMASSMSFAGRLHNINRQFLLALKADDIVQEVKQAIAENKKPIVALQHTGESLLMDFVTEANKLYEKGENPVQKTLSSVRLDRPVDFKDLMKRYHERLQWIKVQGRYGDVKVSHVGDHIKDKESQKAIYDSFADLAKLIDRLPDLPLAPIDYLRHELQKSGITVGEISGRGLMCHYLPEGGISIEPVEGKTDKTRTNKTIRAFNNGDVDVLVLTGAGSTGNSVQSSPAVGRDLRVRRMIKWEMQPDITRERQMDGRPNRTGQVSKPEYRVPLSGLPADDRLAMMFNNKNRSLTASTVSNRDSADLIDTVPDLLNQVGDMAARDLLEQSPQVAEHLDIDMPDKDEKNKPPLWYINKLTGRIALLRVAEQERLYADLQSRFRDILSKLKAEGINPLEVDCLDWRAKVIDRELFMGQAQETSPRGSLESASAMKQPIFLTRVQYEVEQKAVRAEAVDVLIDRNYQSICIGDTRPDPCQVAKHVLVGLKNMHHSLLKQNLAARYKSIEEALADKEPNEVKNTEHKLQWMYENLEYLGYGSVFVEPDLDGTPLHKVVLRVVMPSSNSPLTRLGDYVLYYMEPGFDDVRMTTLNGLFAKGIRLERQLFSKHLRARMAFDSAENGKVVKTARLLTGNIFQSVALNLRERLGRKVVFTDENGHRQHGVLIRENVTEHHLSKIPESVRDPVLLAKVVEKTGVSSDATGSCVGDDAKYAVVVTKNRRGEIELQLNPAKSHGGSVYLDPVLAKIAGKEKTSKFNLNFYQSNAKMVAAIPNDLVEDVFEYLLVEKNINFYIKDRELLKNAREELLRERNSPDLVAA